MNATVCEGDSATFTCVVFILFGTPVAPGWLRNGAAIDMMRHIVTNNLTGGATAPVYINSTVTVSNVRVLDDNGVSYECGIVSVMSRSATLNVVGKYSYHDLMFP